MAMKAISVQDLLDDTIPLRVKTLVPHRVDEHMAAGVIANMAEESQRRAYSPRSHSPVGAQARSSL